MSTATTTDRAAAPAAHAVAAPRVGPREGTLLVAVCALVLSACLPLARVFVGFDALLPILGAAVAALLVDAGCRRLGFGPLSTLAAQVLAWALFVGLVFLPDTLLLGVVPTFQSLSAGRDLWLYGLELIQVRPAPAFPEAGLLLLAVTGVWAVTHAVDGLVFWLAAPIAAAVLALVMWTVPLALAPPGTSAWVWAVPFLAAAAGLLLAHAGSDVERWGRWVSPSDPAGLRAARNPLAPAGGALTAVAIVAGTLLSGSLPGYDQGPWYELRGLGGTTLTTNPIVGIQQRLVAGDTGPVLRVTTPRPVYTRITALDVYDGEREEWTSDSIRGGDADGRLPLPAGTFTQIQVAVDVLDLDGVFVPFPYPTSRVTESSADLRYDERLGAFTARGEGMQPGDRFVAEAVLSTEPPAALEAAFRPPDPALVAVPASLPPQVAQTARDIVQRAGATTPLEQALAIQNELQSWNYSLEVPASHSGSAMARFLETRTGYCEQYAGTMAAMLRTLGIPARVAVGFTPGTPVDPAAAARGEPTAYEVSLANAHAWVEVQFGSAGWLAFEPTPRTDGNVLVPSAANLTPAATVQQERTRDQPVAPAPDSPEDDLLSGRDQVAAPPLPVAPAPVAGRGGASPWAAAGVAASVVTVLAGGLLVLRRRALPDGPPLERVLAARDRVGWLGAGLGLPAASSETDGEYLARLVRSRQDGPAGRAVTAAELLARRVGQARWARTLPEGAAQVAEAAAGVLDAELTAGLSRSRLVAVRARAMSARLRSALGARLRPRRRAPDRPRVPVA